MSEKKKNMENNTDKKMYLKRINKKRRNTRKNT